MTSCHSAPSSWAGKRAFSVGPLLQASSPLAQVSRLRGGADSDEGEDADEVADQDFNEESAVERVKKGWLRTPIITKGFISASASLTLAAWLTNGNEWPSWLDMSWKSTIFRLQLWRPLTAFLYFGPFGINYIITMHFIWTYMMELERMNFRRPYDYLLMILFGAGSLLGVNTVVGLSPRMLGHSLSCFLVYVWSRSIEGFDVNILDMFTLKAELLPWFFVAQTLVLEGQAPVLDLMGIFAGYLYQYLAKYKKVLKAPAPLKKLFELPYLKKYYQRYEREFGLELAGQDDVEEGQEAAAVQGGGSEDRLPSEDVSEELDDLVKDMWNDSDTEE